MTLDSAPIPYPARLKLFNGIIWCCGCHTDITNDPTHDCRHELYLHTLYDRIVYIESLTMLRPETRTQYIKQTRGYIHDYCTKHGLSEERP